MQESAEYRKECTLLMASLLLNSSHSTTYLGYVKQLLQENRCRGREQDWLYFSDGFSSSELFTHTAYLG